MNLSKFFEQSKFEFSDKPAKLHDEIALELNVSDEVTVKKGSMIAYVGDLKFKHKSSLSGGLGNFVKSKLSGEGGTLSKVVGNGKVLLADQGKKIIFLDLDNESISVNGNDVLVVSKDLKHDIKMNKGVSGMVAGGLFNVVISGTGTCAITCHKKAIALEVKPGQSVYTDPNATVAWTTNLKSKIKSDFSVKSLIGRGGGEGIQLEWSGDGYVIVQPYEEVYLSNQ